MVEYMDKNNVIRNVQHEFSKDRSYPSSLSITWESWTTCLDENMLVHELFLNVSNVFDAVTHLVLRKCFSDQFY